MFVHFCTFCKLNTSSERIVGMSLRMFYERTYCTNSMKLGIGKFQTKIHPANLIVVGRHLSMKYLFVRGKILNFVKFIRKRYIAQKCNTSIWNYSSCFHKYITNIFSVWRIFNKEHNLWLCSVWYQ
jgi:hypothetical protein